MMKGVRIILGLKAGRLALLIDRSVFSCFMIHEISGVELDARKICVDFHADAAFFRLHSCHHPD